MFDVNETLIDFESMNPLFERIFGDARVMREWLGHLIIVLDDDHPVRPAGRTTSPSARDCSTWSPTSHGIEIAKEDVDEIRRGDADHARPPRRRARPDQAQGRRVPAGHPDQLAVHPGGRTPLEHAGLAPFFERRFTVETARAYKPAQSVYHLVDQSLGVPPSSCFMVACHVWDTVGAQSAGFTAGLITRPGNAPLPVSSLPQPNLVAPDLSVLADQLIERRRR